MVMAVVRKRQKGSGPVPAGEVTPAVLAALGASPGEGEARERLRQLWLNWEMVMGPELAPLAHPLGRRRDVLRVGAEDAMLAQELQLSSGELLERVNAFMEGPVFSAVKVELLMGRKGLQASAPEHASPAGPDWRLPRGPQREPIRASGRNLAGMAAHSPVARAYARFARRASS
ncbi:MAG: DUF721 domain-containing protein [Desulfovibrio desulfuricans]|jgi:hypothetical protein|nr:DUF721 domain-containing protein [Desulfovibrio desulfuricans]